MEKKINDYSKCFNVLNSCETLAQLRTAERFFHLVLLRHDLLDIDETAEEWKYVRVLKLTVRRKLRTLSGCSESQV